MTEIQKEVLKLLLEHTKEVEIECMKDGIYDDYFVVLPTEEDYEVVINKLQDYIDSI